MENIKVWDIHDLEPDSYYQLSVGPLDLWLRKDEDEVKIAVKRKPETENLPGKPQLVKLEQDRLEQVGLEWSRWVVGSKAAKMKILPLMPDRSVVVRPEQPLNISPGQKALFYVRLPVFVEISVDENNSLCAEPTVEMSNIWFGDPTAGELCYSLRSKARRKYIDFFPAANRVVCPVLVKNKSKTHLKIERFCVHSNHLNIYIGENRIWTNDISIEFQGEEQEAVINYSNKPSAIEPDAKLLTPARIPIKKTLLKRGIDTFKIFG